MVGTNVVAGVKILKPDGWLAPAVDAWGLPQ